jgi:PAS domain S-box-containing protein
MQRLLSTVLLAGIYFAAGNLSLRLALVNPSAAPVWPASGIALAALLFGGEWLWPAVLAGSFLVNFPNHSPAAAAGISIGNTLEAVLGACLVRRFAGGIHAFDRAQTVFQFTGLAAMASTAVSATFGVTSLWLSGSISTFGYGAVWLTWWLGNASGDLIVAPLIILFAVKRDSRAAPAPVRDIILLLVLSAAAGVAIFQGPMQAGYQDYALTFFTIPAILWAAFSLGRRATASCNVLLAAMAVSSALGHARWLGAGSPEETLRLFLLLQAYMSTIAVMGLATAAEVHERKRIEVSFRDGEQRLKAIMDNSPASIYLKDPQGRYIMGNKALEAVVRALPGGVAGKTDYDLLPWEIADQCRASDRRVLESRSAVQVEESAEFPDGPHTFITVKFPLCGDSGSPYAIGGISTDVTERRRAEQARLQLAALVESSDDAIIRESLDGTIESWNPGAEKIYGYSAGEVVGSPISVILPPSHHDGLSRIFEQLRNGDRIQQLETEHVRKDGALIGVSVTLCPIRDDDGKVVGASAVARDITARKQAEQQMKALVRQLAAVADLGQHALAGADVSWCMRECAAAAARTLNVAYARVFEVIDGGAALVLRAAAAPEPVSVPGLVVEAGVNSLAGYTLLVNEPVIVEDLPAEARFAPSGDLLELGVISGLSVVIRGRDGAFGVLSALSTQFRRFSGEDIHFIQSLANTLALAIERSRIEEGLRANQELAYHRLAEIESLYQTAPVGLAYVSPDLRFLRINNELAAMNGKPPHQHIGRPVREMIPEIAAQVEQGLKAVMKSKDPLLNVEIRGPTAAQPGVERDWLVSYYPVCDKSGKVLGVSEVVADISERKKAERQTKASLSEKEVLLREVHHRVKNNLQVISSLLHLQSAYVQDPDAKRMYKESQSRVRSMALVHSILYESTDLASLDFAAYVRRLSSHLLQSYSVDPGAVTLQVKAQPVHFTIETAVPCGLVVNELVSNALKHAFPAGRRGEIIVDLQENPGGAYTLRVADNGVGFPKDVDFKNSASLGLQLVNALAEQLNGVLELRTDGGTSFELTFTEPRYKARV